MRLEEARAWLRGERSTLNEMMRAEIDPDQRQQTLLRTYQADAAATQQAYYIVKASEEYMT